MLNFFEESPPNRLARFAKRLTVSSRVLVILLVADIFATVQQAKRVAESSGPQLILHILCALGATLLLAGIIAVMVARYWYPSFAPRRAPADETNGDRTAAGWWNDEKVDGGVAEIRPRADSSARWLSCVVSSSPRGCVRIPTQSARFCEGCGFNEKLRSRTRQAGRFAVGASPA